MSAFIVSDACMQRVVTAMDQENHSCEDADVLGRRLYELNYQAVNYRYNENHEPPSNWTWRVAINPIGDNGIPINKTRTCELLKAIECLLYQMSEGEVVPATAEYKALKKRARKFRAALVCEMAEYNAAPWD